jgi:hypothetical protein
MSNASTPQESRKRPERSHEQAQVILGEEAMLRPVAGSAALVLRTATATTSVTANARPVTLLGYEHKALNNEGGRAIDE